MELCGRDNHSSFNPASGGGWNVTGQASITSSASGKIPLESVSKLQGESQSYIADALKNMSLEERDEVYHEVHGVADVIDETPELLRDSFESLRKELSRLSAASTSSFVSCDAFRAAEKQDPGFVHSTRMYKIFLRAERFDVPKAAVRMIRYFEFKRKAFGEQQLCKEIQQDMLSADELTYLRKGFVQILPTRDRTGRCITISFANSVEYSEPESLARMFFYQSECLLVDEESQRKGCSLIVFSAGDKPKNQSKMLEHIRVAAESVQSHPIRISVIHHCFSDQRFQTIVEFGLKLLHPDFQARNKLHFGAPIECIYTLMGFGIPQHAIPINMHGEIKRKPHVERLKTRKHQEDWINSGRLKLDSAEDPVPGDDPRSVIGVPTLRDVLLGRGKPIHTHDGNSELQRLVDEAVPEYEQLKKLGKTQLSQKIVRQIKEDYQGRFLKPDTLTGIWLVVDDETARLKVSHLFRARRDTVLAKLSKKGTQGRRAVLRAPQDIGLTSSNKRLAVGIE